MKRRDTTPSTYDGILIGHPESAGDLSDEELVARLRHLGGAAIELAKPDLTRPTRTPELDERRRAIEAAIEILSSRIREDAADHIAAIENMQTRFDNLQIYRGLLADEFGQHEQRFHQEGGQGSLFELANNQEQSFVGNYINSQIKQQIVKKAEEEAGQIRGWEANVDPRYAVYTSGYPQLTPHDELEFSARLNLLQATYSRNGQACPKQHPFIRLGLNYIEADDQLLGNIKDAHYRITSPRIRLSKLEHVLAGFDGGLTKNDTLGQLLQTTAPRRITHK